MNLSYRKNCGEGAEPKPKGAVKTQPLKLPPRGLPAVSKHQKLFIIDRLAAVCFFCSFHSISFSAFFIFLQRVTGLKFKELILGKAEPEIAVTEVRVDVVAVSGTTVVRIVVPRAAAENTVFPT